MVSRQDTGIRTAGSASTEDRLMLEEHLHRTANEVASALAAFRLATAKGSRPGARPMLEAAIERLEGFGECTRLLGAPAARCADAAAQVERVCRAVVRGRTARRPRRVTLALRSVVVEGETARRLALVTHELVTNALKHAVSEGGELEVRLERLGSYVVLSVIDDGPGLGSGGGSLTSGTRLGGRIVGELVRTAGGSMDCDTGPSGTAIHVTLPINDGLDGGLIDG